MVHLVRASLRYASKKYWSAITKRLKLIYTAPDQEAAEAEFTDFCAEWEDTYPAMTRLWRSKLGTIHPVPGVPTGVTETRVYDERDREPEFPVPASHPAPRTFP